MEKPAEQASIAKVFPFVETMKVVERKCENWLTSFKEYTANSEAPADMLFWTGISTVAGALRRRVWIDMRSFIWVPNFYIILVAPPGVATKSTTVGRGMELLADVPGVNFGPSIATWQALIRKMDETKEEYYDPDADKFIPMSAITMHCSELGVFLDPKNREMIDTLVHLWDGQPGVFSKSTKTSGNDTLINPWINLIGCTTPSWITENLPSHTSGGGFLSRVIFVHADRKEKLIPYPDEIIETEKERILRENLINDLIGISMLSGKMVLTPEAREWGKLQYANHWGVDAEVAIRNGDETRASYNARKQTHMHKIAMVLSAAEGNSKIITLQHLREAEKLLTRAEECLSQIGEFVNYNPSTKFQQLIVETMKRNGAMTKAELFHRLFKHGTKAEFDGAINSALQAGYLKQVQQKNDLLLKYVG